MDKWKKQKNLSFRSKIKVRSVNNKNIFFFRQIKIYACLFATGFKLIPKI